MSLHISTHITLHPDVMHLPYMQPRHYYEPGVGIALRKLLSEGVVSRRDLFLQTKYSPLSAQVRVWP